MVNDRRTGIDGDQITDATVTKDELDIINTPLDRQALGWDATNSKFKWYNLSDLATRLDYYEESEGESYSTSTSYADKISYTTATLLAGTYEFWFQCEIIRTGNGAIQKARMIIDNVEYGYNSGEADFVDWKINKGFKRITFATEGTHTIKLQFATGTSGRSITIRRARIRVLSVGI